MDGVFTQPGPRADMASAEFSISSPARPRSGHSNLTPNL